MKINTIACDLCQGKESPTRKIESYSLRRGTRRWQGETCDKCFARLLKEFNPSDLPRNRHIIEETKIEDIARK